ncbi:response regulator [Salipaludibacillus aurantiacus]|uniref:Two-component response regulator, SAPR family, consists of REC, wHTH and BTAD domains n=1 Tax=Salipaludibacillus aurantiacus TaxID=1601833 RepID=A0A1H9UFA1_9BACI|nr:response regulator [Salipaludibacillus aurantiacus]SES07948.1 Two-component response regulator, SAPR family, consists of REC, wHTH and BTAD domains [Salipaludibacillus aurantiacus]
MNVLLVDDEELALNYLENLLVRNGKMTNIYRFSDAEQAKSIVESQPLDVLFLDIEMPGMSGFELAEYFLSTNETIDIVFVTAHREFAIEAFDLDAVDYLVKPIRYERLCHTIERLNKRKKSVQAPADNSGLHINIKSGITLGESRNDEKELTWRTAKARELFLYLLHHHNKIVPKSEIVEVIWNDRDSQKSFPQLYTTVYHIRRELKSYAQYIRLKNKEDGYCLEMKDVQVDVFIWKKALYAIEDLSHSENRKTVERLLEDYAGDYLLHSDLLWAEEERWNQKLLWREKAMDLAGHFKHLKKYTKALYWYQKILQKDEIDEEVHFCILKIYDRQNRADLVTQHYENLVQILQRELEVRPGPSIEKWYREWSGMSKK